MFQSEWVGERQCCSYDAPFEEEGVYCFAHVRPSVCPPLRCRHCEVSLSIYLVSMGLHSVHLVGIELGLGINGVKKSICGVALNKE